MKDAAIGIFDSGMGGLTVMRALLALLPNERFLYLGDTARLPYGTKSAETVARYAVQAAGALARRNIKLLVVACNTASGVALPALLDAFAPLPVVDVIGPGAEAAVRASPDGPIAVIATEGTVKAGAYVRAIHARAPGIGIVQLACPLFVPLAEEGLTEGVIAELVAHRYLDDLLARQPRALVLGCTHYPALKGTIGKVAGLDVALVDSAQTTAAEVERRLRALDLLRDGPSQPDRHFLVTDAPERFSRVGEIFLGRNIDPESVELVDLQ
ncbi:MAG TPA: glutamate racemase [Rhizomicrobium sp.]|jgi:glutamate racemase|nr:glutamate racemase [Rhizomicrobium sp.]